MSVPQNSLQRHVANLVARSLTCCLDDDVAMALLRIGRGQATACVLVCPLYCQLGACVVHAIVLALSLLSWIV
jgi:hypothetical protein